MAALLTAFRCRLLRPVRVRPARVSWAEQDRPARPPRATRQDRAARLRRRTRQDLAARSPRGTRQHCSARPRCSARRHRVAHQDCRPQRELALIRRRQRAGRLPTTRAVFLPGPCRRDPAVPRQTGSRNHRVPRERHLARRRGLRRQAVPRPADAPRDRPSWPTGAGAQARAHPVACRRCSFRKAWSHPVRDWTSPCLDGWVARDHGAREPGWRYAAVRAAVGRLTTEQGSQPRAAAMGQPVQVLPEGSRAVPVTDGHQPEVRRNRLRPARDHRLLQQVNPHPAATGHPDPAPACRPLADEGHPDPGPACHRLADEGHPDPACQPPGATGHQAPGPGIPSPPGQAATRQCGGASGARRLPARNRPLPEPVSPRPARRPVAGQLPLASASPPLA